MENKYFTPNIEDVYIGYELEWKCKIRNQDWEKTICDTDLIAIIYDEYEHADFEEPYNEQFRVPYLTKEQIEAEGWKLLSEDKYLQFIKPDYSISYVEKLHLLTVIALEEKQSDVKYSGTCKDINTFRKIIKLLGI